MQHYSMNLKLKVWRQRNANEQGRFETYDVDNVSSEMSFLEMIDVLNERLIAKGDEPIAFDHDCREGICGMCYADPNVTLHHRSQGERLFGHVLRRGLRHQNWVQGHRLYVASSFGCHCGSLDLLTLFRQQQAEHHGGS